jgi:hypothetical protein
VGRWRPGIYVLHISIYILPLLQKPYEQTGVVVTEISLPAHPHAAYIVCLFPWASAASHGCTAAYWLIVPPSLDVPTLATRCPAPTDAFRTLAAEVGTYGRGIRAGKFCLNADFHDTFRDLLHAANLRHGTHGFTSLPKEGVLRIFLALKIRRLRPGLNPRTWVPEASTLTPRSPKPLRSLY